MKAGGLCAHVLQFSLCSQDEKGHLLNPMLLRGPAGFKFHSEISSKCSDLKFTSVINSLITWGNRISNRIQKWLIKGPFSSVVDFDHG